MSELDLMMDLKDEWLDALATISGGPDGFLENHCIMATRVAIDVGTYFGWRWEPLPVDIIIMNAKGHELVEAGVPVPEWPDDAWSVGCDCDADPVRFSGHLIVAGTEYLLDLSAGQFNRPERDMIVTPWIAPRPPDITRGGYLFGGEHGQRMSVHPRPEQKGWRNAPDWRRKDKFPYKTLAGELIRRLNDQELVRSK